VQIRSFSWKFLRNKKLERHCFWSGRNPTHLTVMASKLVRFTLRDKTGDDVIKSIKCFVVSAIVDALLWTVMHVRYST